MSYYANKTTKRIHTTSKNDRCRKSAIKASNREKIPDLKAALTAGYKQCCHCFAV